MIPGVAHQMNPNRFLARFLIGFFVGLPIWFLICLLIWRMLWFPIWFPISRLACRSSHTQGPIQTLPYWSSYIKAAMQRLPCKGSPTGVLGTFEIDLVEAPKTIVYYLSTPYSGASFLKVKRLGPLWTSIDQKLPDPHKLQGSSPQAFWFCVVLILFSKCF